MKDNHENKGNYDENKDINEKKEIVPLVYYSHCA